MSAYKARFHRHSLLSYTPVEAKDVVVVAEARDGCRRAGYEAGCNTLHDPLRGTVAVVEVVKILPMMDERLEACLEDDDDNLKKLQKQAEEKVSKYHYINNT